MLEAIISPVMKTVLEKLGSLIARETQLFTGASGDAEWLRDELQSMRTFLQAAEEANSGEDRAIPMLVDQIRDVVYDSEDILDVSDLSGAHTRVRSFACFGCYFKSQRDIGSKIREIRSRLDDISRRRSDYRLEIPHRRGNTAGDGNWIQGLASSPLVYDGELMVGVEKDLQQLLCWVVGGGAELSVVSLVGMGGMGKTTLVKKMYNNRDVKRHFDRCAWIYVSQSVQLRDLLAEMAKGLMEFTTSEVASLNEHQLQESLLKSLEDKRYLVVLDDVWSTRLWDAIKLVLPRNKLCSRVIMTTRNNEVASSVVDVRSYVHRLYPLSSEESWTLFCKKAFAMDISSCPEELKETAEGIVRKCDGLPLAIVTVGGMMLRKERTQWEWECVLSNLYKDFSKDDAGVQHALLSSYKDLPSSLKSCFLLFSVFPHDYEISRKRLIRLWLAEGFIHEEKGQLMEVVAEKYLVELIDRSMVQVSMMGSSRRVKACRVHDLLHQLAIFVSEKESFSAVCEDQGTDISNKSRRISVQKNCNAIINKGKLRLRSLFMFSIDEYLHITHPMLRNIRFLRVLDLEDACLWKLPSEVGNLIHLRYLGLKGTRIKRLPKSLKKLHNLQTLDIRRTHLTKLPFGLESLKQLRHLEMRQDGKSVKVQQGIGNLERLQVVTGLQANRIITHEIGKLTQLRKLHIKDLQPKDAIHLCSSINNMSSLSSLSVFSKVDAEPLDFRSLTHLSSLQKLHIAGCLERLPDWFGRLRSLTKLRLVLSRLSEDPFPILENLPSLVFLQLYEAYQGKIMRCSKRGFNKLKILLLTELEELEEWKVEEGAMPCIQELWIMSCSSLKMIPSGLEFLTTMQTLRLVSMSDDFVARVSSSGSEDFIRVQHIPSVQVL